MGSEVAVTFAELATVLGEMHDIAESKRTAFQARLKNFHRLGFPVGLQTTKGKAATYNAGHMAEMALAVELTQLGLPPERVVRVLTLNWYPAAMAITMAARALLERPEGFDEREVKETDPLSMFLYFDPTALASLMDDLDPSTFPDLDRASDTFFYGGEGVVRENIVRWTSGSLNRISLINVTSLLDRLVWIPFLDDEPKDIEWRRLFFSQLHNWASDRSQNGFGGDVDAVAEDFLSRFILGNFAPPKDDEATEHMVNIFESYFGLPTELIRKVLTKYSSEFDGDLNRNSKTYYGKSD